MKEHFKGTLRLLRLAIRRDRLKLSITFVAVAVLVPALVNGVKEIFPSQAEMVQGATLLAANPAMRLFGLPIGTDMGHILMLRSFVTLAILAAFVSTFLVIRHTRQNEEVGRSELVKSGPVGRYSFLTSSLILVLLVNSILGLLIATGFILGDLPIRGAILVGTAAGLVGLAFASIAFICAQVAQTSRSANNLAASTIGVSFILSGIGSVLGQARDGHLAVIDPHWASWLSPIGWAQTMRPFAENNLSIIWLFVIFSLICIVTAWILASKRDDGQGILAASSGKASASSWLLSLTGLNWRLNRGVFIGWLIGSTATAAVFAVMAPDVSELLSQAEGIADILIAATGSADIVLAFFGAGTGIAGILSAIYVVQMVLKLRVEENRALELMFSGKLSKSRWLISSTLYIVATTTLILLAFGLVTSLLSNLMLEDFANLFSEIVIGSMVQLPAVLLIMSLVLTAFALLPRLTNALAWSILSISIIFSPFFSSMFNLPDALINLSPLAHSPSVPPLDNLEAEPLIILSVIALVLISISIIAFRRRDLQTN